MSNVTDGELRIITGVSPSGSISLVNPNGDDNDDNKPKFRLGAIFPGDFVIPIMKEYVAGAHAPYVKVLTRIGVGYISEFVLKKQSRTYEDVEGQAETWRLDTISDR